MVPQTPNPKQRHHCTHINCTKSYLRVEHLNRHRLIHQERAFACYICKRQFTRNDLLQAHIRRLHEDSLPKPTSSQQQEVPPSQFPPPPLIPPQETHQQNPANRQISKPGWDSSTRPFAPPGEIDFGPAPPPPPTSLLLRDRNSLVTEGVRSERERDTEPLGFPLERVIFGASFGGGG